MAEYLHPGVYVEEKKFGTPPVAGGSASVGAFVGFTPRVKKEPVFISSWVDFVNQTSLGLETPFMRDSYLAYAVYGFFNNGGRSLWLVSATDGTDAVANTTVINGTGGDITFSAKDGGEWGNDISVKLVNGDKEGFYNVEVYLKGGQVELHRNVSLGAENNLIGAINNGSRFIEVSTDATEIEASVLDVDNKLSGGLNGLDNVQDTNLVEAMKKFDSVEAINLLVMPESQSQAVISESLAYAQKRQAFFVADGGMNDTFDTIQELKDQFSDEVGALYYPWVQVSDPIGISSNTKFVPCAGHVAGMIARTDEERGIFKAPAGVEATLRGVIGVKTKINDAQQDILNPKAINVIRSFPNVGIVVWGARTMANTYINVRRELTYVQQSILNSTKWAVFEPNNSELWRRIRNQINEFLRGRYALGAYRGESEAEAFFVKCDAELNTTAEINAGRVNTEVGVSINKPGEFIIFRVGQWDGGGEVA